MLRQRWLKFALLAAAAHAAVSFAARADTLEGSLADAYRTNPTLNAQRASVRATDENVPQALAGYRPRVAVTASGGQQSLSTTSKLTASELGSFFLLLVVAGNETTRTAISHGMLELTRRPDQRKLWADDFEQVSPTAVEEIVRWATPVIHFRRTATRDTIVGGQEIKAGEKVVMFYNSANRDERAFDDPYRFDLTRTPNEHVGFGAGGPHFCLGANLARREIKLMFEELLRRLPDIEITGEPDMLQSNFIHGIKRMPCAWHTVAS